MKLKIFLSLIFISLAFACNNSSEDSEQPLAEISYHYYGGLMGYSEKLILTPDSIHYHFEIAYKNLKEEKHSLISANLWADLQKKLDVATFTRVKSGESFLPLDGLDKVYRLRMKNGQEVSFVNGYGPDYDNLESFRTLLLEQLPIRLAE